MSKQTPYYPSMNPYTEPAHPCPLCNQAKNISKQDTSLSIYYCKQCAHVFSVVSKNEPYNTTYFSETHKNWYVHPDTHLFKKLLAEYNSYKSLRTSNPSPSLLDLGCGKGQLLHYFLENNIDSELYGIDFATNKHQEIQFLTGDLCSVSFNKTFTTIVSTAVIEHVNNPHEFLNKIDTELAHDGVLIIMTINRNSLLYRIARWLKALHIRSAYDRLHHHHHIQHWSNKSLANFLKLKGFQIKKQWNYNAPLIALDFPSNNPILVFLYKGCMSIIYVLSNIFSNQWLQVVVCTKKTKQTIA